MEKKTVETRPDGTTVTTVEKTGFVFRDAAISIIALAGSSLVAIPAAAEVARRLPVATNTIEKVGRAATVAATGAAVEGIATMGITNTLNEIADLGDEIAEEVQNRAARIVANETSQAVQEEKSEPKATNVRDAKKKS